MKKLFATLMLAALVAAAGCATKTTPTPEPVTPPPVQAPMPTTDVTQQPEVRGVESQPVQSGPVADHQAVAGLERVHFAYNQFTLDEAARITLEQNAVYLRNKPAEKVVIEGHCDERGSDEYNLALGERRAVAAKNYLVSLGIAADRLSIISYGEEKPLVAESNEEAWAKNRRAEFKAVR
ncbi:MAG: peptidoglycan-associated lipoprotein Pal [Desulfuromonadales bacterium]